MIILLEFIVIFLLVFVIIIVPVWWFDPEVEERREVRKLRKQWYAKYPIGTNIQIKSKWNVNVNYFVVVSEEEFLKNYCPGWKKSYLDMNNVLLCAKGLRTNQYVVLDKDSANEIRTKEKEISKVSDVKMKILELERRKKVYENIE